MGNHSKLVRDFVSLKINSLISKNHDESHVRAALAKLRRGVGKHPGSLPDIWDYTINGLPKELLSESDEPTAAQWAAHLSITLFAVHQQGKDIKENLMSKPTVSLGSAVRNYIISQRAKNSVSEDAIKRRFDTVVTSDSPEELAHHLRTMVKLLKSGSVALDYPQLAEDLFKFQFPAMRDGVRLRWGQDYYKIKRKDEENEE